MKVKQAHWARRYQTALRKHLAQGRGASLQPALALGRRAVALGLETLDLARYHEQALVALAAPDGASGIRPPMIARARRFFAETIVPVEKTHRAALKSDVRVNQLRDQTRAILSAQEHDRQKTSHLLQDEIAQGLLGIHVRLLTLKKALKASTKTARKEIGSTQRLVRYSTDKVNRFAYELGR